MGRFVILVRFDERARVDEFVLHCSSVDMSRFVMVLTHPQTKGHQRPYRLDPCVWGGHGSGTHAGREKSRPRARLRAKATKKSEIESESEREIRTLGEHCSM